MNKYVSPALADLEAFWSWLTVRCKASFLFFVCTVAAVIGLALLMVIIAPVPMAILMLFFTLGGSIGALLYILWDILRD